VRLDAIKGQFPGAKLVSCAIPAQGDAMPF
jgi:hypothetical protein